MSDRLKQPPLPQPEPEVFRRRQFVAPHRQKTLLLRLLRPFLTALAIVGLPSTLVAWILYSPQFAIADVKVTSSGKVSAAWVADRLEALEGRRLFEVDLEDVETALAAHDWVGGAQLRRTPPNRLEVEILERVPVALVVVDQELFYLDAASRIIGAYDPRLDRSDLVLLSAPDGRSDLLAGGLELVDDWRRKQLPFADGLSEISALSATDFRITVAELPFPLYVSSLNLADGLAALVRYRPQLEQELRGRLAVGAVDLRFRERIVFQPAVQTPHNIEGESNA